MDKVTFLCTYIKHDYSYNKNTICIVMWLFVHLIYYADFTMSFNSSIPASWICLISESGSVSSSREGYLYFATAFDGYIVKLLLSFLFVVTLAPLPLQMELRALIHARQMWYHWSTSLASNKDTHTFNSSYWYIRLKVCCSSTSITHLNFYVLSICCPSLYLGLWIAKTFIENTVPRHRKIVEEKYSLNKTRQRLFAIWKLIFLFFFFSVYLSLLSV